MAQPLLEPFEPEGIAVFDAILSGKINRTSELLQQVADQMQNDEKIKKEPVSAVAAPMGVAAPSEPLARETDGQSASSVVTSMGAVAPSEPEPQEIATQPSSSVAHPVSPSEAVPNVSVAIASQTGIDLFGDADMPAAVHACVEDTI